MSSTFAMCTRSFSKSSNHLSRASDLIVQSGHSVRLFVRLPRRRGNATSLHTHPGQPAHHIALPPSPDDIYTRFYSWGVLHYTCKANLLCAHLQHGVSHTNTRMKTCTYLHLKCTEVVKSRPGLAEAGECKQVLISLVPFQWKDSELNITYTRSVYPGARHRPRAMFNQSGCRLNQRVALHIQYCCLYCQVNYHGGECILSGKCIKMSTCVHLLIGILKRHWLYNECSARLKAGSSTKAGAFLFPFARHIILCLSNARTFLSCFVTPAQ